MKSSERVKNVLPKWSVLLILVTAAAVAWAGPPKSAPASHPAPAAHAAPSHAAPAQHAGGAGGQRPGGAGQSTRGPGGASGSTRGPGGASQNTRGPGGSASRPGQTGGSRTGQNAGARPGQTGGSRPGQTGGQAGADAFHARPLVERHGRQGDAKTFFAAAQTPEIVAARTMQGAAVAQQTPAIVAAPAQPDAINPQAAKLLP